MAGIHLHQKLDEHSQPSIAEAGAGGDVGASLRGQVLRFARSDLLDARQIHWGDVHEQE